MHSVDGFGALATKPYGRGPMDVYYSYLLVFGVFYWLQHTTMTYVEHIMAVLPDSFRKYGNQLQ